MLTRYRAKDINAHVVKRRHYSNSESQVVLKYFLSNIRPSEIGLP